MSVARFRKGNVTFHPTGGKDDVNWERVQHGLVSEFIEIADTGAAGTVNAVRHGLGRVPRGVRLVQVVIGPGAGPVAVNFYREDSGVQMADDDAWTETQIALRFSHANVRVLLEVF
jgi:hypothetical protein